MRKNEKEIDLELLKKSLVALISLIQGELGINKITLVDDFYWEIAPNQKYRFTESPSDFEVGQLYDDVDFILNAIKDDGSLSPAMLCHVVPLLNYLNYLINEKPIINLKAK